eukprot:UN04957
MESRQSRHNMQSRQRQYEYFPTTNVTNPSQININYPGGYNPNILLASNSQISRYSAPQTTIGGHGNMTNMMMLNNGYAPYLHYNGSYIATAPTATSLSPYMAPLHEYYHRNVNVSVHTRPDPNKMYQLMMKNKLNEVSYEPNHQKQSK